MSKERKLTHHEEDTWIVITERQKYVPTGYVRGRWSVDRIYVTREELHALALKYLLAEARKQPPGVPEGMRIKRLVAYELPGSVPNGYRAELEPASPQEPGE